MSTIKSSDEHLTLNADGSSKDIKFQANGVEKASISSSGAFTSTTIDATKLTGALPAISGAALTGVGVAGITSSADATAITIDSSEQVGIGQAPTDYQLVVREPNGDKKVLELSTGDSTCRLAFSRAGDPSAYIDMKEDGATGTGGLHFGTGTSYTPTTTLKLTSDGKGRSAFTSGAWVRFNQTNHSIFSSHNISSISDIATGQTGINFDTDYNNPPVFSCGTAYSKIQGHIHIDSGQVQVENRTAGGTLEDTADFGVMTIGLV